MSSTPDHGYWRSLAELRNDPDYVERAANEFSEHAAESPGEDVGELTGISRRRFLALAGASTALATAACDSLDDRGEIVPYVNQPESTPAGEPRLYASALLSYPGAPPVLIQTREGRPIKVEGNPEHPASRGGLGGYGQSATLLMYDPNRVRSPQDRDQQATWDEADDAIVSALSSAAQNRKTILLITPSTISPTTRNLIADFTGQYPTTKHLSLETFHTENVREGRNSALGTDTLPTVMWNRADVVLSVECDFLGSEGTAGSQRGFAERRSPEHDAGMSRLWSIEGPLSLTGSNADHRLRLRPSAQPELLLGILHEIVVAQSIGPLAGNRSVTSALANHSLDGVITELHLDAAVTSALVADLISHQGRSAVLAGARLPASTHSIVAAINASLGNEGSTIIATPAKQNVSTFGEIAQVTAELDAGGVDVVLNLGADPVYSLPRELRFGEALRKAATVVSAVLVPNDTSAVSGWVLPLAHDLESWGDTDTHHGTLTLQQPAILPLHEAAQSEDILLRLMGQRDTETGEIASYYDYLRARWQTEVIPSLGSASPVEQVWNAALHEGFITTRSRMPGAARLDASAVVGAVNSLSSTGHSGTDVALVPAHALYDGRFANSGWLQENPNPITAQVWGNAANMAPTFAEAHGIHDGDAVSISIDGRSVTLPAVIQPGYAEDTIAIELGYGRTVAGDVGSGVGVDATPLVGITGGISTWLYTGAEVAKTSDSFEVVRTQEHFNVQGRPILMEGSLAEYQEQPDFVEHLQHAESELPPQADWPEQYKTGNKWGMAIDLSLCSGCNGCTVACYAENNIPVVGPEQVAKGREMTWLRVDTYYRDDPDDPKVAHQPMLCQHCENAPCEVVCPVAATVHSPDGLNEMIYNRCVGTRYCANNCPYKVRRFNFHNWHEDLISPQELMHNPEVTVRTRGVMEKCSFCVQRIRKTQHDAGAEDRAIRDGELQSACQQACPTDAIVFGDLNDTQSKVAKLADNPRGYKVLGTLDTQPRITYLAKIRNLHPDLAHESHDSGANPHDG
jgi:MoCo/4Fe-4S cofactor protein with predicted Tat translocation signal